MRTAPKKDSKQMTMLIVIENYITFLTELLIPLPYIIAYTIELNLLSNKIISEFYLIISAPLISKEIETLALLIACKSFTPSKRFNFLKY